jgi:hypothetical protein
VRVLLAIAAAVLAGWLALAARAGTPTVTVVAGTPTEASYRLSAPRLLPAGTIVFQLVNGGAAAHGLAVCTRPGPMTTCPSRITALLRPGRTATLTVKLGEGTYRFSVSTPGRAKPATGWVQVVVVTTVTTTIPQPTGTTR